MHKCNLTIDFANLLRGKVRISFQAKIDAPIAFMICEAFNFQNGPCLVEGLVGASFENDRISFEGRERRLAYDLNFPFTECLGSCSEHDLAYPYRNDEEFYLGGGALPTPYSSVGVPLAVSCQVQYLRLPDSFHITDTFSDSNANEEQLAQFFLFGEKRAHAFTPKIVHVDPEIRMHYTADRAAETMNMEDIVFNTTKSCLSFYIGELGLPVQTQIKFLHLLSPLDFKQKVPWPSFSTGHNVLNGIVVTAPDDCEMMKGIFGVPSYLDFIIQGIVHEIGHFWTSAGEAKTKSILFATDHCPHLDRKLLGESLNGYFTVPIQSLLFDLPRDTFWKTTIEARLRKALKTGRPECWINLFLVDSMLQKHHGIRLWDIYRGLIELGRKKGFNGFSDLSFLTEYIRSLKLGVNIEQIEKLLQITTPSDYFGPLTQALTYCRIDLAQSKDGPVFSKYNSDFFPL
ncbi:MAG: hypothetical protein HYV97_01120 [Bdellovibrio sp.]|nr:hypothetical protein [Bdellovibrio sp.]